MMCVLPCETNVDKYILHSDFFSVHNLKYLFERRLLFLKACNLWSILLIKSDLKWCIHLSRSLFSYSSKCMDIQRKCVVIDDEVINLFGPFIFLSPLY